MLFLTNLIFACIENKKIKKKKTFVFHIIVFIFISEDPAVLGLHQNQSAVEGTEVLLTAKVKTHGNPRETYTWLYSKTDTGTKIVLADGFMYTIQNISRNDTGCYTITATNFINATGIPAYNTNVSQSFWLDVFCKYLSMIK